MAAPNKEKNKVEKSKIKTKGDVTIGDQKTINIYGMQASQKDVDFVIKFFMGLVALFAIAFFITLFFPGPKKGITDFIATFAAGGFCTLLLLFIVFLVRSKNQSNIHINQ